MRDILLVIPIMTVFANFAILLDIPLLREIIVFIFLSFIPGFAILRLFKLKEISFLDTILFSVALSIAVVMLIGLLVNELYLFLGISQSLSTIPLTVAISTFTLTVFFVEYFRRDLSITWQLKTSFEHEFKKPVFPLLIILFILPLLSAIGVLYFNSSVILLSEAIIAALCILSVVSRRLVPENFFPFLIFSISLALICQVLLTTKYVVIVDANLEYYVFRLTQISGHWGFLNANVNSLITLTYDSMLSITLLPAVYSTLMNAQSGVVFKILYPFIFCFVPLALYRICEKQFGKLIGLLSALFFVFTSTAFYGEPLGLNRQIVGELFFILSIFLLISKTIPLKQRRYLLIIFGTALVVSHYSLAYIYLAIVTILFIISRVKPRFDDTLNTSTVLLLFGITFAWYSLGSSAPLMSLVNTIKLTFGDLTKGVSPTTGSASNMFFVPQVFTIATWINLLVSGIANLFLIIGVLSIKGHRISAQYKVMITIAGIILVASFIAPSIASSLNFTRFYGITLLFLSPCFVLGGKTLLVITEKAWTKIKLTLKRKTISKSKNLNLVFLLIAILLSAYFLSQVGFINLVTNGEIHTYNVDFYRMITSNDSNAKISLYDIYIPEQDVSSATWLSNYKIETATVFADYLSESHVLISYGLIPNKLLLPITNTTIPPQGSFIYLGSLNIVNGVITTTTTASYNTSQISSLLDQNDLVYSNGNSEIWYVAPTH